MPGLSTVFQWLSARPEFAEHYARAREVQLEHMAAEILEISDDGRNDYVEDEDGREVVNTDHIQRSKLRVDTRKWLLSKLKPKVYGDAQTLKHADADGNKIQAVVNVTIAGT